MRNGDAVFTRIPIYRGAMFILDLIRERVSEFMHVNNREPSDIYMHPEDEAKLVWQCKQVTNQFEGKKMPKRPFKYRGASIYRCLDLREGEIRCY
jgi:hypothetical protein